jgi:DNA polymerase-1
MAKQKTVLFVDGHAMLYRAFHGYPDLTNPQGELVNALYGFGRLLLTSINDFQPEFVAVMFDHRAPTFRHEQFDQYKAHREEMPDGLRPQVDMVKELVDILNIPRYELAGYEADDLIGTATWQLEKSQVANTVNAANTSDTADTSDAADTANTTKTADTADTDTPTLDRAVIMTGDSDLLQLASSFTKVFIPKRGKFGKDKLYSPDDVQEKYGVMPFQLPQLKALTGDSSDNIPGVPGIGPKTARTIFESIDTIAQLYQILDTPDLFESHKLKSKLSAKIKQSLLDNRDLAQMSLELATIERNVPFKFDLEACRLRSYDKDAAVAYMEKHAFKSLISALPEDEFEAGIQSALF